jgi:hypothetical protein
MSDDTPNIEAAVEPLFVLNAQTTVLKHVAGTPGGDRMVVDVVSGTFDGPLLSGRIPPSGGDWLTRTARGSCLDVRLVLETHDGVTLLFRYQGKASQRADKPRIEVAGSFDAPAGAYAWLNDVQTFGLGVPLPDGVRYHFYRFT